MPSEKYLCRKKRDLEPPFKSRRGGRKTYFFCMDTFLSKKGADFIRKRTLRGFIRGFFLYRYPEN